MKFVHDWIVSNICVKGKIAEELRKGQQESECDFGAYIVWSARTALGPISPEYTQSMKDYLEIGIPLGELVYIEDYPEDYILLLKRLRACAEYNIAGIFTLLVDFSKFPTETLHIFLSEYEYAKSMKPDPCMELGDAYPDREQNIQAGMTEILSVLIERHREEILAPIPPSDHPREGFVYLLRSSSGYWKIGRTIDPNDRIRTFSVKLPFEVAYEHLIKSSDMARAEAALHGRFESQRANGEWFRLDENDIAYIKAIKRL